MNREKRMEKKEILEIIDEHWKKNDVEKAHELKDKIGKCYSKINQGQRKKNDFYETPYCLTRKLLTYEEFQIGLGILEPAAGNGAIVKVIKEYGHHYSAFDLYGSKYARLDFLKYNSGCGQIITNPPYSLADQFVQKAKDVTWHKFAYFMKLDYLSGQKRYKERLYTGLRKVLVLNRMPDLRYPIRDDGLIQATGMQTYAWYIWHKGYKGKPKIDWLDISDCIVKNTKKPIKQELEK